MKKRTTTIISDKERVYTRQQRWRRKKKTKSLSTARSDLETKITTNDEVFDIISYGNGFKDQSPLVLLYSYGPVPI